MSTVPENLRPNICKVIIEHVEAEEWLVFDTEAGDVELAIGADEALVKVKRRQAKLLKDHGFQVALIEWRNVPAGFEPPES